MRFSFIHAADLHIDSPLAALGKRNADAAGRFAAAGRKAVVALVDETIASKAVFLIIAGDIFDGDWADYTTGLFFSGEMARLDRAGITVFVVRGNHDAESKMSKSLSLPPNVVQFSARKAESFDLADHGIVLHGKSFPERNVPDDFVASYPARQDGLLNIGVLHTALDGVRGHKSYAPCTVDDLRRFGYDYWALGHIHKPDIVSDDPWIVFPGNIQGRSARETGPRGAMRVTVEDGRITSVEQIVLDAARWAHETVDISSCGEESDVLSAVGDAMTNASNAADGRALAVRLTLAGESHLHAGFTAQFDRLLAECQNQALRISDHIWVERLRLATHAPQQNGVAEAGEDGLDVSNLLQAAADDPAFADALSGLAGDIRGKLPADLRDAFDALLAGSEMEAQSISTEAQTLLAGYMAQDVPG